MGVPSKPGRGNGLSRALPPRCFFLSSYLFVYLFIFEGPWPSFEGQLRVKCQGSRQLPLRPLFLNQVTKAWVRRHGNQAVIRACIHQLQRVRPGS